MSMIQKLEEFIRIQEYSDLPFELINETIIEKWKNVKRMYTFVIGLNHYNLKIVEESKVFNEEYLQL